MTAWHCILDETAHRPYPLPRRPWAMTMSWHDLLFLHVRVAPGFIAASLPQGLEVDLYQGAAWISVVPFRMSQVGPRGLNHVPLVSAFPEVNVRTYATGAGKRGVWFFSLDAASRVAVEVARKVFHLPYLNARIRCTPLGDGWIRYESERRDGRGRAAVFRGSYRGVGPAYRARPGSLEEFLTERYCLFAADAAGKVYCGDIHHVPWPLRDAELSLDVNTMVLAAGAAPSDELPLLQFVERLDVVAWQLEEVAR